MEGLEGLAREDLEDLEGQAREDLEAGGLTGDGYLNNFYILNLRIYIIKA